MKIRANIALEYETDLGSYPGRVGRDAMDYVSFDLRDIYSLFERADIMTVTNAEFCLDRVA